MTISIFRIIGALGAVMVTTAAMCNKDAGASLSTPNVSAATAVAPSTTTSGAGLPADFPLPPGLSACRPRIMGPEVICVWHKLDQPAMHAMYTFYHDALPKAGYDLNSGSKEVMTPTDYMGAIGFKKGNIQGALMLRGGDLTIQVLTR